jgi:hypothetical protein
MTVSRNHILIAGALLMTCFVAGCSGDAAEQLFVKPGRFDYLSCPELVTARQNGTKREQELKTLIDRAEKESIGVVVAGTAYRGEYLRVQGEQKMIAEVMQRKSCDPDTPPAPRVPNQHRKATRH